MSITDTQPQHEARDERHRFSHIYHADLIAMAEIGPSSLMVYAFIAKYADYRSRKAFPSIDTLAQDCNLSRNTVMKAIRDLSKAGLLKVTKEKTPNGYQKSTYTLMSKIDKAQCKNSTELGAKTDKSSVQKLHPNDTHVNDTHVNEIAEPTASAKQQSKNETPKTIDLQIMDAFAEETGLAKFANFGMARKQAKQLANADFTPNELRELVQWLKRQDWIKGGISLGLCLNQADSFRVARSQNQGRDISPSNQKHPEPATDVDWGPDPNLAWMLDPSLPKPWEKDNG